MCVRLSVCLPAYLSYLFLFLCLSLSLADTQTQTHTRTHANTQTRYFLLFHITIVRNHILALELEEMGEWGETERDRDRATYRDTERDRNRKRVGGRSDSYEAER